MVQSLKQNSIHGTEQKQNSIHGTELKQRKQEAEQWKMNFLHPIWKRTVPHWTSRLTNYYQDKERNINVDDYPSVHTTLPQSSGE